MVTSVKNTQRDNEKMKHQRTTRAVIQASKCHVDSLSSRLGVAGIMYGAEVGTGVRADSSGERKCESSKLLPLI